MRPIDSIVLSAITLTLICSCTPTMTSPVTTSTLRAVTSTVSPVISTTPAEVTSTKTPYPTSTPTLPAVVGPAPSYQVAAFYYPWYHNPEVDGYWDHWGEGHLKPPLDIASDFYPSLGTYSVADPAVVAQHMVWLREAGVGVIVSSWWGPNSREDRAVPLLLDLAERYGIKVAFHIEPYHGRTADKIINDVRNIYSRYGDHPAFF